MTSARPATSNILQNTLAIHQSLCIQLSEREQILDTEDATTEPETTLVQKAQHEYHRIQPLSRAPLIFSDHPSPWLEEGKVQLIRTEVKTGLSQPINFESIPTEEPYDPEANVITMDFATAIDFVIALEWREMEAGCVDYDGTVLGKFFSDINKSAQGRRYTSDPIKGPSTSWVTKDDMATYYAQKKTRSTMLEGPLYQQYP
jgi:hypothetical protein